MKNIKNQYLTKNKFTTVNLYDKVKLIYEEGKLMPSNDLGRYLKEERTKEKLTLGTLSERINYSDAYISMVENGVKIKPSFEFLTAIAKGLDLNYYYLLYLAKYIERDEFDQYTVNTSSKKLESVHEEIKEKKNMKKLEGRKENSKIFQSKLDKFFKDNGHRITQSKLPNETVSIDNLSSNIYFLLNSNYDLFYKEKELTEKNKQDISKFIETFIIDKGE